jgi:DNA repair exonuclease SbcCD ATPase subunit
MSSIFKKIKSAFIIEESTTAEMAEPGKKGEPESRSVESTTVSGSESPVSGGHINPKFTDILLHALEAKNQEGFDYIEFKRSLQNLARMNMDEATIYKSAYATAQTLGATPKGLTTSAEQYLDALKAEEAKFELALNNQRAKQIDGGLEEIKQHEGSVQQKAQQIEKLQEEIRKLEEKLGVMRKDIEESARKIEATRADFVASYHSLVNQIKQDIENIGKYLN